MAVTSLTPISQIKEPLNTLWQFSRPHTIYGTTISLLGLFALAYPQWQQWGSHGPEVILALLACLCMNVYIVGLNQLIDVEIDRINKPYLPLAAGTLTYNQGLAIVTATGMVGVWLSFLGSGYLMATVMLSGLIGTAYSLPPIRLKRFPVLAASCIYIVRGWIVNLGLYSYFRSINQLPIQLTSELMTLTLFISIFGLVIAIFKDIPDIEGDQKFQISTFSIQLGSKKIVDGSIWALCLCYLGIIGLGSLQQPQINLSLLSMGHLLGLVILLTRRMQMDIQRKSDVVDYYQLIWKLFYFEYLLYPLVLIV